MIHFKKLTGVLFGTGAWAFPLAAGWAIGTGGIIHDGHVDCGISYINGQWQANYTHQTGSNPLDPNAPAEGAQLSLRDTVLVARDQAYDDGSRVLRPVPPVWDFIGAQASGPLWWFPQTSWPKGNYVGFTMSGPFATYQETDPRLAGSVPEKWGRVNTVSLAYRGKGNGRFSIWTNSTASGLKVWVDSRDGFQETDRYFVGDNGHGHPAMGFSSLGLYKIGLRGKAWLDEARTEEVVSPEYSSYVAVGTYAIWIAEHFSPQRWFTPEQSGETADLDGDGIPNLMEYACGLDPRTPDSSTSAGAGGLGLPELRQLEDGRLMVTTMQRTAESNPQISYRWEVSESPSGVEWLPVTELGSEPVDASWRRVFYEMPAAGGKGFGRLRVELMEAIDYP